MFVYVCMYLYMYVNIIYIYVCVCINIYIYIFIHTVSVKETSDSVPLGVQLLKMAKALNSFFFRCQAVEETFAR